MKRLSFFGSSFFSILLLFTLNASAQSTPATNLADLQARLAEHVNNARFDAGTFGVKVVSLDSGKTIFEHDANKLLSPASNCKIYTVATALDFLGGDYRIKTSLYATARPNRFGTIKGDLIVYGRGDPGFNQRLNGGDIFRALQPLVAVLTNAGVKRISGDLIGDESFIRGTPYGSGWDCDDLQYYYGAEISALTINDNTLEIIVKPGDKIGAPCQLALSPANKYLLLSNRTETVAAGERRNIRLHRPLGQNVLYVSGQMPLGGDTFTDDVTMHRPAGLFIALFKEALARNGIKVTGKLRTMNWLDREVEPLDFKRIVELGSVESQPMRDIAREIMKPSQNLYTDLILAHVGSLVLQTNDSSRATSEDAGVRQIYSFLNRAGVPRGDVQFEEGSGLSRNNLVTPNATIALLKFMDTHREADAFMKSMPIAGVDGTLRNRMKNTPAANNVKAKTGTLRWANALSGHVTTAAGERLIFSIMLNRYATRDSQHPPRGEIDKLVVMLAEFSDRSDK